MYRYTGGDGIYTLTTKYERDPDCLECSAAVVFEVRPDITLREVRYTSSLVVSQRAARLVIVARIVHLSCRVAVCESKRVAACFCISIRYADYRRAYTES